VVEPCRRGANEGCKVMDVACFDDHVSVTGWPACAEAARRSELRSGRWRRQLRRGNGLFPVGHQRKSDQTEQDRVRSEWRRIIFTPCIDRALPEAGSAQISPEYWSKDGGIARRCKLFLGAELERALCTGLPVRLAVMERKRDFEAANMQAES